MCLLVLSIIKVGANTCFGNIAEFPIMYANNADAVAEVLAMDADSEVIVVHTRIGSNTITAGTRYSNFILVAFST